MEVFPLPYSPDQTISSYKQQIRRNPNRNIQTTTVPRRPSENFSPASHLFLNLHDRGLLLGPPPPPYPQPKPPLLPLPINNNNNTTTNNKPCSRNRGISCPPTNRKTSKVRNHQDLTAKKTKPSSSPGNTRKKQEDSRRSTGSLVISSTEQRLGPEPNDLPKEVSRVMMKSYVASQENNIDDFSRLVFYLSPPPSSLPLPKFSLRPKLSCNVEAGGIDDAGVATDNLRRLLRLL